MPSKCDKKGRTEGTVRVTAKLTTRDARILAGVEESDALVDGSTILHSASDKSQVGCSQFDRGYVAPHFVTDPGRMEVVLEEVYILIHEKRLSSKSDLIPYLSKSRRVANPCSSSRRMLEERRFVENTLVCPPVGLGQFGKRFIFHLDITHLVESDETIRLDWGKGRKLSHSSTASVMDLLGS